MKATLLLPLVGLAVTPLSASATVIYSQNFDSGAPGWSTNESTGTATTSWASSVGNPAGSMFLDDGVTNGVSKTSIGSGNVAFSNFNTSTAGQGTLIISFDLSVSSFLNNSTLGSTRFVLFNTTSSSSVLTVGFGSTTTNGTGTNVLFAAPAVPNPSLANAFGGGTGAWNFGSYDTVTGANNDTNGWIHFDITYVNQSTTALVTASYGVNSTSLTLTGLTPTTYGKPTGGGASGFSLILQTGGPTITGQANFDNFQVQVVPEPKAASLLLLSLGACIMLHRRNMRRCS